MAVHPVSNYCLRRRFTRRSSSQRRIRLILFVFIAAYALSFQFVRSSSRDSDRNLSTSLFPGTPASSLRYLPLPPQFRPFNLPEPFAYVGHNARFLFHTAAYGQFNNQIVSLINALLAARHIDAVLVLPYAYLGKESNQDLRIAGRTHEISQMRQLVGDYFNYTHLLADNHVLLASHFFASPDGLHLLQLPNVTVARRSGKYYRTLFHHASIKYLFRHRSPVSVISPAHPQRSIQNFCDLHPQHILNKTHGIGRNGRYTFLPIIFGRHNLNCTIDEPDWVSIRRSLIPRFEFLHAVDDYMRALPKPIFSLHLRFFLDGDIGKFTVHSFTDMLFHLYAPYLAQSKTVFVAYSPSSELSRQVYQKISQRFHGLVTDSSNASSHYRPSEESYASMAFSSVLFDMWVCVKSSLFLGRLGSSLSWNVVYWRQAFSVENGLNASMVSEPLWYALPSFTTTGATRRGETHIRGLRLLQEK